MYTLLISDRDRKELQGLYWLVSKYSFPISEVKLVHELPDMIAILKKDVPDILCVELDMIPEHKWEMVKSCIDRYSDKVIAITAEATFERAMQAISIKAIDLWVKPFSPSRIKHSIQQSIRGLSVTNNRNKEIDLDQTIRYEALFMEDNIPIQYPVFLLEAEDRNDLKELHNFIHQFDFYDKPSVFLTPERIFLVFHYKYQNPVDQAKRLLREWQYSTRGSIAIVVHSGNEKSLHQIYSESLQMMETTFFTGYQQVFMIDDFPTWADMDPFLTVSEQRKIVYILDEGQADEFKTWMYGEFFDIQSPYPNPGILRIRLTSILAQIRRFMFRKGLGNGESEDHYKKISEMILYSSVLYRIVQEIILFMDYLFQMANKQNAISKVDVTWQAITYMESNYSDSELSLTEVATYVDRSSAYLSHLLSKKYQQSFREMLSYIRLQKAKELLGSTDDSIQSIASSVGFNNPNYFSRVFKTYTGKTPSEWKWK